MYEPRIAENLSETRNAVDRLLAEAADALIVLTEAIEEKKGAKAIRDALRTLQAKIDNAPSNAEYAVSSLAKVAEKVVSQARADIEAHVLSAAQATGLEAPLATPHFVLEGAQERA